MATANSIRSRENAALERRSGGALVNVSEAERLASKIGGGVLVGVGLMRGGVKGLTLAGLGAALLYRGTTGHCSLYQAIGANTAEDRGPFDSVPAQSGVRVEESVVIACPADELFRFWRDYSNLPKFMGDIESVTATNPEGTRSHWIARAPMGVTLEWDAEIHNEIPGEMIAWRSTGGQVETAGSVHFEAAPGDRGTIVRVNQKFNPPGGKLGVAVARLLGHDPEALTRENLHRLKQIMESGAARPSGGSASGSSATA